MRLNRRHQFALEATLIGAVVIIGFFSAFQAIGGSIARAWQWVVG